MKNFFEIFQPTFCLGQKGAPFSAGCAFCFGTQNASDIKFCSTLKKWAVEIYGISTPMKKSMASQEASQGSKSKNSGAKPKRERRPRALRAPVMVRVKPLQKGRVFLMRAP
jgi:hypothetical protein